MTLWQTLLGGSRVPALRYLPLDSAAAHHVARLHAQGGFARAWSPAECEALLAERGVVADGAVSPTGPIEAAVLSRQAADEAEMLIIMVNPALRRNGIGRALLRMHGETLLRRGVRRLFLEVDEGNGAARALYQKHGFVTAGSRAGYYPLPDGTRATALIMRCELG
jgi:[ribosomal protein S18]-alanine N-acetyltransferase